eukprot:m.22185 g.22185  ORF g.22185 m.22185 type:complete len:159 (+) comp28296_c0_seq8:14-490(+)
MDIVVARQNLVASLGEDAQTYWMTLKLWYQQKITKREFDDKATLLLGDSNVQLHNEFLLAILAKCQEIQAHSSRFSGPAHVSSPESDRRSPTWSPKTPVYVERMPIDSRKRVMSTMSSSLQIESLFVPVSPRGFMPQVGHKGGNNDWLLAAFSVIFAF